MFMKFAICDYETKLTFMNIRFKDPLK